MRIYKHKELDAKFYEIVGKAKQMWASYCRQNYAEFGDSGSCVLGAGISIHCIPSRCRKAQPLMIISSNEVAQCQGSLNWERHHEKVVEYLISKGIDAYYTWGNLD